MPVSYSLCPSDDTPADAHASRHPRTPYGLSSGDDARTTASRSEWHSHRHADHIGAAIVYGPNAKIMAHEKTRELLERFPDLYRPVPTETFSKDATLHVSGVKLNLSYKGQNHSEGNVFIYAPKQKVLAASSIWES